MKTNLQDILAARDRRLIERQTLLEGGHTVVSMMLNIPGDHKLKADYKLVFETLYIYVKRSLENYNQTLYQNKQYPLTGPEGLFAIRGNPKDIKILMIAIENEHPFGRLVDLDVYDVDNVPVSREQFGAKPRKCYLCHLPAKVCSRNKTHKIYLILEHIQNLIQNYLTT